MNNTLILPPQILSLITTFKCTASCKDCCFECTPKKKERMSLENMKFFVDQVVTHYNSVKLLVLTGGECFILGNDLNKIVKYASTKGFNVRIVTNGYWAINYETALKT